MKPSFLKRSLRQVRLLATLGVLAIATGVMWNFALGFTAIHTLIVVRSLLPAELRPGLIECVGLLACAVFYLGISVFALSQQWPAVRVWLGYP